jgi:hypothetical protein
MNAKVNELPCAIYLKLPTVKTSSLDKSNKNKRKLILPKNFIKCITAENMAWDL